MIRMAYMRQRRRAQQRGIPFKLTYLQWLEIWAASGVFDKRGRKSGQYNMARHGDKGAYEVGNVSIVTHNQNMAEANAKRKGETRSSQARVNVSKGLMKRWAKNPVAKQELEARRERSGRLGRK
jgi:hypothetical protein